jgi:hypothetical protein
MIFRKKSSLVEAMQVNDLLNLSKSNFGRLPDWIRNKFRTRKIFIGMSTAIICTSGGYLEEAKTSDFILLTEDNQFILMTEENFKKEFEEHSDEKK